MKTCREHLYVTVCLLLWFAGCVSPPTSHDPRLAARLDPVLNRLASTGAIIHARVVELPSRRELYAARVDSPCTPASNFKLLTSAAGLDMFGADHKFKTYLATDGDDLWIIGTGDPAPGDYRLARAAGRKPTSMLQDWAKELRRRGIAHVKGDIVYDDWAFEDCPRVHPTWPKHWLLYWYAAPTTGLSFNDNSIDVTVYPTEEGKPVRYEVMPPAAGITIINECFTGDKNEPAIAKLPEGNIYKLTGQCSRRTELASKPVDDPGAFFADALRTQLAADGITVAGRIRRAQAHLGGTLPPPPEKVIAIHETSMRDILSRVNKNSQNLFAECLCKLTGREYEARRGRNVPGSWDSGGQALRAFLRRNGIDDHVLAPMDGSGLSPQNRVSTRMLTDLLAVMHSRPDREAYIASLTVCGVDGSLRDRMKEIRGRVLGKTGYIGGVSSTSGYVKTREGKWLAFSFVYNNIPRKTGEDQDVEAYTKLQDEACRILADWPRETPSPASRYASDGRVKTLAAGPAESIVR